MNWHSRQRLNPSRSKTDRITIAGEMKLTTIASDKHFATPLPADLPLQQKLHFAPEFQVIAAGLVQESRTVAIIAFTCRMVESFNRTSLRCHDFAVIAAFSAGLGGPEEGRASPMKFSCAPKTIGNNSSDSSLTKH
jgi:hypothetical protein